MRVVDHKSATAQARKATTVQSNDNNAPFSIHNYNEHVTPSAFVPYPKHNQLASEQAKTETAATDGKSQGQEQEKQVDNVSQSQSQSKGTPPKPRVFTTVLHPTARSLQAELTLLATTPDPKAAKQAAATANAGSPAQGPPAKRQKMLVEPQDLLECESKLVRALAPPLFLDPVDSPEAAQDLLKFLESPLHRDAPPSPKRRKRTVAELAADEALAAEEERFMLIMDERLEPTTSNGAGGTKTAVDDTGGGAPFEPRFSRFKTLESIRMQHEEKAKREHEIKVKQEMAKRQQQEVERERRRVMEQRQAEEHAREEARRQQLATQQAHLAQQNRVMAQANGVTQGQQSSPVVRNQTPLNASSPMPGNTMVSQPAAVPMSITSSAQAGSAGSPARPPSALQHANMMSHPMAASRSQQGPSRNGTPQITQGTPAMSHATPIMRNVTPTQRMGHGSPNHSTMSQTPVMNQGMMTTPQIGAGGMGLTPQQQSILLQQRQQQILAQQGQLGHGGGLTPQQISHLQANVHAQQDIRSHQQHMMQQQNQQHQQQQHQHQHQQQNQQHQQRNQHAYQAQLVRAQLAQMQQAQQQAINHQGQQQQQPQQPQQPQQQPQQNINHQGSPQMTPQQQQQMMMAAAQANGGQLPQNFQGTNMAQRYNSLFQHRLLRLRQEMASRYMAQYGPPTQYPPQIAQQYTLGLERSAKMWVQELVRREREQAQQQRANHVAAVQAQVMQQQQQQNMMHNGMGK